MDNKDKIIVIGDIIIDIYSHCETIGLSAETPTISLKHIRDEYTLGGAGLVYRNLKALNSDVTLISTGNVSDRQYIDEEDIVLIEDDNFSLTKKQRFWSDNYKHLQVLRETKDSISSKSQNNIINKLSSLADINTKIIFCDYRTGFFTEDFCNLIFNNIENNICFVDSQCHRHEPRYAWFKNCIPVMNLEEAEKHFKKNIICKQDIQDLLKKDISFESIIIKNGKNGVTACNDEKIFSFDGHDVKNIDTCGAGDAFLASFVHMYNGKNFSESLEFANEWAACSTTLLGTIPVSVEYFKEKKKWTTA
tara:strand:+ start:331 stop:1248 length:918 start_codon:yes stop_codon:yes gene_type:complete